MKQSYQQILLTVMFVLVCVVVQAQVPYNGQDGYSIARPGIKMKNNAIKILPFDFFISTFSLAYERQLVPSLTLQLTGSYTSVERDYGFTYGFGSASGTYSAKAEGYGGELQVRKYLMPYDLPMSGWYVAGFANIRYTQFKYTGSSTYPFYSNYPNMHPYYIQKIKGGVTMGYHWLLARTVVIDAYIGGGMRVTSSNTEQGQYYFEEDFFTLHSGLTSGVFARMGASMGIVF